MPRNLSDLFGRYSLPNVMGRLGHRIGDWFHHEGDTRTNYPISQVGGLQPGGYNPGSFQIGNPFTSPQVGSDPQTGGSYGGGQMSDPFGGGFLGGMGGSSSGYHGNSSGGTLGPGYALDPSQWGSLFNNDAGDSVPYHTQYATGMGGGHGGSFQFLPKWQAMAAQHHMGTGGNMPSYDSSGINPGGMYTGGNQQAHPILGRLGGKPPGGIG